GVGGRVWAVRYGLVERQHGEAGGDLIDAGQAEIRTLAAELGLKLTRILRGGFGGVRRDGTGRPRIVRGSVARGWHRLGERLADLAHRYNLAEQRWDSPIAADLPPRSTAPWLDEMQADGGLRPAAAAVRGVS